MFSPRIFLGFAFLISLFYPQSSLELSTFSSGSFQSKGEKSSLYGSSGQVFVGEHQSDNTILSAGLWGSVSLIFFGADDILPLEFSISKAYPNPFNPTVNVDFSLPEAADINIQIFDLMGRIVFTHKQQFSTPGYYKFKWSGRTNRGTSIASGVYLVNINHKSKFYQQKITFLK